MRFNVFLSGGGFPTSKVEQPSGLLSTIFENFFTFAFVLDLSMSTLCWGWTYLVKRETLGSLRWQVGNNLELGLGVGLKTKGSPSKNNCLLIIYCDKGTAKLGAPRLTI